MKKIQFKCTLLSDVIINAKSATEGNNTTQDFIPGNNFLGIAASIYNTLDAATDGVLFHSGKVRFGDAHPAQGNMRSVKVPASMYYPKLKSEGDVCYIHHCYQRSKDHVEGGVPQQLKQCRNGFYSFHQSVGTQVIVDKTFVIKSAYDRMLRRSRDEAMYGYESIDKGGIFFFDVETDVEELAPKIVDTLTGTKRVGRSRTAQYGLVKIEQCTFTEIESRPAQENIVTVYADGRLIFIDENGLPTFTPTALQLGLDREAEIVWEKSQVLTFQYSPWNFKRQARDNDRCGIEKGSVFVVKSKTCPSCSQYVGSYRNEGFGKVIYNPLFLDTKQGATNGEALFTLRKENERANELNKRDEGKTRAEIAALQASASPLLKYLAREKRAQLISEKIYKVVNDFVKKNRDKYTGDSFASQWGAIRSIAMKCKTKKELLNELFDKTIERHGKVESNAFLTHGKAAEKWKKYGRRDTLKEFLTSIDEECAQLALINLASQMAKECRNKR